MQLLPRYLVSNRIDIIANLAGFITEYKPVYKRQLTIYKGIDNVLEFRLLNADQKPVNTQGYTPKFRAYSESGNLIIAHDGVSLDDGSTAARGLFTVTVTENDLFNVDSQFLKYTIFLVDADEQQTLTYADTHFGVDAVIKISQEAFPGPQESNVITTFGETAPSSGTYISSTTSAEPNINGNEALHTAAVYTNGYVGNLVLQATLSNQIAGTTDWADLTTLSFTGDEVAPTPVNFNGIFGFIRFKADADPTDTITKILVRN